MTRQLAMFPKPARAAPRVMAKLTDAGDAPDGTPVARYVCRRCGWDSGWIEDRRNVSSPHRGVPCERCWGAQP